MRLPLLALLLALPAFAQPVDIFLLIGQSNMAGRGLLAERHRQPQEGIWAWTKDGKWAPAVDPLHWDKPEIAGVGLGRSFAATLKCYGAASAIGLVPAAFGGSALEEWSPGSTHYKNAIDRTRAALAAAGPNARLRGILWHQGEADSTKPERAYTYTKRFAAFIAQLRADLKAEAVPVLVGQLGEFIHARPNDPTPFDAVVNEQLLATVLAVPKCGFVSSRGLAHKGDVLHFDTPSLEEFGRRYALEWLALR